MYITHQFFFFFLIKSHSNSHYGVFVYRWAVEGIDNQSDSNIIIAKEFAFHRIIAKVTFCDCHVGITYFARQCQKDSP